MASDDAFAEYWRQAGARYERQVDDWVRAEAEARGAVHGLQRRGIIGPERDYTGLRGEIEFGQVFHQPVDFRRLREGDKGIDFVVPMRCKIDVKTTATATPREKMSLLVPVATEHWADVYVQAYFDEAASKVWLLGWEWASHMREQPLLDLGSGPNYAKKVGELRKMPALAERIMRLV